MKNVSYLMRHRKNLERRIVLNPACVNLRLPAQRGRGAMSDSRSSHESLQIAGQKAAGTLAPASAHASALPSETFVSSLTFPKIFQAYMVHFQRLDRRRKHGDLPSKGMSVVL